MITTAGKTHIKRYLALFEPTIAQSIAFGIGTTAENVTNYKMAFEIGRTDILLTSYDFATEHVVFKGALPDALEGTIYEVGLYSAATDSGAAQYGSKMLASFDSATEAWTTLAGAASTFTTSNSRLGANSLRHTPALSSTSTDVLTNLFLDLSGHSAADTFVAAYNVGNAFTSSIKFRFLTDASNYYELTISSPTSGYKVTEIAKSAATVTGSPDWANITEIRIITASTSGGASQVDFDGLRIDDNDSPSTSYLLVAREVLVSPFVKEAGRIQEVEFNLTVAV